MKKLINDFFSVREFVSCMSTRRLGANKMDDHPNAGPRLDVSFPHVVTFLAWI